MRSQAAHPTSEMELDRRIDRSRAVTAGSSGSAARCSFCLPRSPLSASWLRPSHRALSPRTHRRRALRPLPCPRGARHLSRLLGNGLRGEWGIWAQGRGLRIWPPAEVAASRSQMPRPRPPSPCQASAHLASTRHCATIPTSPFTSARVRLQGLEHAPAAPLALPACCATARHQRRAPPSSELCPSGRFNSATSSATMQSSSSIPASPASCPSKST